MLFTLVTIASAHFNFQVHAGGKVIDHYSLLQNERQFENNIQRVAERANCEPLFGNCGYGNTARIRCCEDSIPGSWLKQISPLQGGLLEGYTIKCSAAEPMPLRNQLSGEIFHRYTKVQGMNKAENKAKRSRMNRYCLPIERRQYARQYARQFGRQYAMRYP